jgi:Holliday junction DNA helicase RuvA
MIGRIHGILLEKLPPVILVDVAGVGYEINVSMYSFYRLPSVGESYAAYTFSDKRRCGNFVWIC